MVVAYFLLPFLLLVHSYSKNIKLQLTSNSHYLVLFADKHFQSQNKGRLNFQIDFSSSNVTLSPQLKEIDLYLDKNRHKKISDKIDITYKTIKKTPKETEDDDDEDQISGIVGMKRNSDFIKAIKNILNVNDLKLWFKIYENIIEVIPQSCSNPLFGPYEVSLRAGTSNKDFKINQLSFNFYPKKDQFLSLLNKKTNPFRLQSTEKGMRLNLQLYNEAQSISLKTLMGKNCMKYSGGQEGYECTLPLPKKDGKQIDDTGLLLFQFDPIICNSVEAIELMEEGRIDSEGYYWGHMLMLGVQFIILCLYRQHDWLDKKVDRLAQKYK